MEQNKKILRKIAPIPISLKMRMKQLIKKGLAMFGLQVKLLHSGRPDPIDLWEDDDTFNNLMKEVTGYTLVDKVRCFMIYQYARQVIGLNGNVAEIGVYRGGTARLLAEIFKSKDKKIYLFDTFSGMPTSDSYKDLHKEGDFDDTSLENIKYYLRDYENVRFCPGFFPVTTKPMEDTTFCFVHVDADIYTSIMDSCKFFYPRMEKGGIIVFDDYGFLNCPGVKMAVEEFFSDKPETPCYLPSGQCVISKL